MADRTQAPSGAGYALENRAIISPTFPDLLRELKVQPLTPFFRTMHDSLVHWGRLCAAGGDAPAPLRDGDMPLIVLLTAGPRTASYYEQAYLARYLGLPLVEGGDLTVRDGVVYLKTLAGLQRVHVIMRRVDDEACDPLELDSSMLGVAGLTQAAQARQCAGRQQPRFQPAGIGRPARLPAGAVAAPAGRTLEDAVGGHLVVRRTGRARGRDRETRPAGDQAAVSPSARNRRCSARTWTARRAPPLSPGCAPIRTTSSPRKWCGCRRRRCGKAAPRPACRRAPSACACSPAPRRTATW